MAGKEFWLPEEAAFQIHSFKDVESWPVIKNKKEEKVTIVYQHKI